MRYPSPPFRRSTLAATLALCAVGQAHAYEVYSDESRHLNADMTAVFGQFNSRKNYNGTPGGSTWREGFIKYGLSGDQALAGKGTAYGAFSLVSSATWGDGDPRQYPRHRTHHEN